MQSQFPGINLSSDSPSWYEVSLISTTKYKSQPHRTPGYFRYDGERLQPVGNMLPLERKEIPITFPFYFDVKATKAVRKYMTSGDTASPYTYLLTLEITCNGKTKTITTTAPSPAYYGVKSIDSDNDYISCGYISFSQDTDEYTLSWEGELVFSVEELDSSTATVDFDNIRFYETVGGAVEPENPLTSYICLKDCLNSRDFFLWVCVYCVVGSSSGSYNIKVLDYNTTLFKPLGIDTAGVWELPSINLGAPDGYGGRILLVGYEYVPIRSSTIYKFGY